MADYIDDISTDDYIYRQEISVTEIGGEDRYTFPVKIDFDSSNFNFSLAETDGIDIRIGEASNGTRMLNTWIATWSYTNQTGTVWITIPSLLAGETKSLFVYWGHPSATSVSNLDEIAFLFASDFNNDYTSTHLAYNKTCSQSSTDAYPAENAVDWNTNTYSRTNIEWNAWWKVDLGAYYDILTINYVKRSGYPNNPRYFYIQTADDYDFTINVQTIITENNQTSTNMTYTENDFGILNARYFRILTHTENFLMYVAEFYVWNKLPDLEKWRFSDVYDISNSRIRFNTDGFAESKGTPFYSVYGIPNYEMIMDKNVEGTYDTSSTYRPYVIKESVTSYKAWYSGSDGTNWRIMYAVSENGTTWSGHQMVVDINEEGTYDTDGAHWPSVVKESASSYKMWYGGYNGTNWRILYADSSDGITWANHQMVISTAATHDLAAHVIKESASSYKMWYSRYTGSSWGIYYTTSTNGTTWATPQLTIAAGVQGTDDVKGAYGPCVIKESSTSYKIWYAGQKEYQTYFPFSILYARSVDGIEWLDTETIIWPREEGIYDLQHAYSPFVIKESATSYKMWYSGNDFTYWRVIYTTSTNGIDFPHPDRTAVTGWIVEEGVYVPSSTVTDMHVHRPRFYGTENDFGINYYIEGSNDRQHNFVTSSWVVYNGTEKGLESNSYTENYVRYYEENDTVYQAMSKRDTYVDYVDNWERRVHGDTRITYFRLYGRNDDTAAMAAIDWVIVREYFAEDPYSVDTSNLYVQHEHVAHQTIDWGSYDADVTSVNYYHSTSSGGDPYRLSDNLYGSLSDCWVSDANAGTGDIVDLIIDFGRSPEEYNIVRTTYVHYDSGHVLYYGASKLSDNDEDVNSNSYFKSTTVSGYVCIDFADDRPNVGCLAIRGLTGSLGAMVKDYIFSGGDVDPRLSEDTDWDTICTGEFVKTDDWQTIYFEKGRAFRYFKLEILSTHEGDNTIIREWQMYEYDATKRKMVISQIRLLPVTFDSQEYYFPKEISISASNDMFNWYPLKLAADTYTPFYDYIWGRWQRYSFGNIDQYYCYKVTCSGNWNSNVGKMVIAEWEMMEKSSEAWTYRVMAGDSDNFRSVWAGPRASFDAGFFHTTALNVLSTVYGDELAEYTIVSGTVSDMNVL